MDCTTEGALRAFFDSGTFKTKRIIRFMLIWAKIAPARKTSKFSPGSLFYTDTFRSGRYFIKETNYLNEIGHLSTFMVFFYCSLLSLILHVTFEFTTLTIFNSTCAVRLLFNLTVSRFELFKKQTFL